MCTHYCLAFSAFVFCECVSVYDFHTLDVWVHYRHIGCMGTLCVVTDGDYSQEEVAIGHFEKANKYTERYSHKI